MDPAVTGLIIFGICIVLFIWDKLPMATSAILGCALMVLFGVADFKTVFEPFGGSTVIMLIGVLAIGIAVDETGIASRVGRLIIKATRGSERTLILVAYVTAFLLSTFLTNVTVLAIFIPVIFALGRSHKQINPLNIVIPLTLAVNMGGISTLVGSSQQMTAQGLLEEYGYIGFKVFDFAPFGLICGAAALLYCLFIGYPLGKKIWGDRERLAEYSGTAVEEKPIDKKKAISISIIFVLMVVLYIFQGIPFTSIKIAPHITAVLAALACIITGCVSQKTVIKKMNWNIVGRLAGCLGIAKALSAAGSIDLMAEGFMNMVGADFSPFLLFAVLTLLALVASLFISNSTAISITLLVVISIAPTMGLNVPTYAMGIVFASSFGASCPLSGSTWGVSMAAGYKFRDYFKYGIGVDLLLYVVMLVTMPLIMGLTV